MTTQTESPRQALIPQNDACPNCGGQTGWLLTSNRHNSLSGALVTVQASCIQCDHAAIRTSRETSLISNISRRIAAALEKARLH